MGSGCRSCGADATGFRYCIQCGAEVEGVARRGFAAAPNERSWLPRIGSTLFPQLPRGSMTAFRIALLAALALVGSTAAAGAYPLAIVLAAVAVPTLMVIYLYDVDVYEDEPAFVGALTAA